MLDNAAGNSSECNQSKAKKLVIDFFALVVCLLGMVVGFWCQHVHYQNPLVRFGRQETRFNDLFLDLKVQFNAEPGPDCFI